IVGDEVERIHGAIENLDVVAVEPYVVIGRYDGQSERNEGATADEKKACAGSRKRGQNVDVVVLGALHRAMIVGGRLRVGKRYERRERWSPLLGAPHARPPSIHPNAGR